MCPFHQPSSGNSRGLSFYEFERAAAMRRSCEVTWHAKRAPVIDLVSETWMRHPWLDVVCVQRDIARCTELARVIVSLENGIPPLAILPTPHGTRTISARCTTPIWIGFPNAGILPLNESNLLPRFDAVSSFRGRHQIGMPLFKKTFEFSPSVKALLGAELLARQLPGAKKHRPPTMSAGVRLLWFRRGHLLLPQAWSAFIK